MAHKLPHGWSVSSIGQLFKLGTKGCNPSNSPRDQFLHYSIPALDETGGPIIEMGKAIESNKLLLTEPCILVSKLNPRKSRVVVYKPDHNEMPVCASTEFIIYVSNNDDEASIDYFAKYMASEPFRRRLERIAVTVHRIFRKLAQLRGGRVPSMSAWTLRIALDAVLAMQLSPTCNSVLQRWKHAPAPTAPTRPCRRRPTRLVLPNPSSRRSPNANVVANLDTARI
jgi:hypothetical protein